MIHIKTILQTPEYHMIPMHRTRRGPRLQTGFTLLEIILTLVLIGIAAAMIVPYFQSGVTQSSSLVARQESIFDLNGVMANMIADYEAQYTQDISALSTKIGTVGSLSTVYGDLGNGHVVSYLVKSKQFVTIAGETNKGLAVTIADARDEIHLDYLFTMKGIAP